MMSFSYEHSVELDTVDFMILSIFMQFSEKMNEDLTVFVENLRVRVEGCQDCDADDITHHL